MIKDSLKTITLSLATLSLISVAYAWTEPSSSPPAGNVSAPVNVSSIGQIKTGSLEVNGLRNRSTTVLDGNVGVGTASLSAKLQVNGDIRANNFKFPDGTIAAGPWQIKTKTYTLSVSDCSASGFTSWKGQSINLPKYTVKIDFDMPAYSCDPDTGVCSPIPDNQGTWAQVFNSSWTRIGYRGLNCKPYQTNNTRCGWGNQNPGNTYQQPSIPSNSYIYFQTTGYCTKYGSDHTAKLVIDYWEPVNQSIPNSSYITPSP